MRKTAVFYTLLVLVALGCAHATAPQLDAQSVLLFTLALDMEQAQPSKGDATPDQPDAPGVACMCLADPNYPCPCRENPAACKHSPKCKSSKRAMPASADVEQSQTDDWSLSLLLEKAAEAKKTVEAKAEAKKIAEAEAEAKKIAEAVAEAKKTAIIVQAPMVFGADPLTLWKQNLPPTTLVVCTQPGCAPCKVASTRIVAPLVKTGWHVVYVDIAHSETLAASLSVPSTPLFIGFKDGVEVGRCGLPQADPTQKDRQGRQMPAPAMENVWTTITAWFSPNTTPPVAGSMLITPTPPSK